MVRPAKAKSNQAPLGEVVGPDAAVVEAAATVAVGTLAEADLVVVLDEPVVLAPAGLDGALTTLAAPGVGVVLQAQVSSETRAQDAPDLALG